MNDYRPIILVLLGVALVWSMQLAGVFGIFFLAILGATVTEGLRGSLPLAPAITRSATPVKFWLILSACAGLFW